MKNLIKQSLFLLFFFTCIQVHLEASVLSDNKEEVSLEGKWDERERSLKTEYPIAVYWDGMYLYIESSTSRSDIHILLSNEIEVIKEEYIPARTSQTKIYIGILESNKTYQLTLTNQFGDELVGIITIMF